MTEEARVRLARRARMVGRIRRGVVVAVLAAFVLAWGVIAATGSMGSATAATTTSGSASSASSGTSSATDDGNAYGTPGDTPSSDGGVTTAQS
jgi:hypothetical protein